MAEKSTWDKTMYKKRAPRRGRRVAGARGVLLGAQETKVKDQRLVFSEIICMTSPIVPGVLANTVGIPTAMMAQAAASTNPVPRKMPAKIQA